MNVSALKIAKRIREQGKHNKPRMTASGVSLLFKTSSFFPRHDEHLYARCRSSQSEVKMAGAVVLDQQDYLSRLRIHVVDEEFSKLD